MGGANTKPSPDMPPRGSCKPRMEKGRTMQLRRTKTERMTQEDSARKPRPDVIRNAATSGDARETKRGSRRGSDGRDGDVMTKRVESMRLAAEEEAVDGWPKWLADNIPREVLAGLVPKSADSYVKIDKVGQGTYSNVYKARDRETGKIVALKKVRFNISEPESVKFMAREIMILQKLDHPNIVKLEGLATSRMQYSLYLVFDYMHSDLARVISRPGERLSEPQIKCYMHQLLLGLQHCHERGILHRDIKGSNLLIDKDGTLKIADFGLANYSNRRHLTSHVVTLWYRAPELLLGATEYGVGIDLWSAGCLMAEMFAGRPVMPGRTEVEQLHKIFKLCGTPSDDYWKKTKAPATFKPPQGYKPSIQEVFRNFPPSSLGLLKTLLALNPATRGSSSSALQSEFFRTSPLPCDLSGLPVIYKEEDDPPITNEKRRHRGSSKMRQRSNRQKESPKDGLGDDKPKGDSKSPKEEGEKRLELNLHTGSTSASSTSSSIPHTKQEGIAFAPPPLPSPDVPFLKKNIANTEDHKNNKNQPPLPMGKTKTTMRYDENEDDNKYRISRMQRSASTREFERYSQKKILKLRAIDD